MYFIMTHNKSIGLRYGVILQCMKIELKLFIEKVLKCLTKFDILGINKLVSGYGGIPCRKVKDLKPSNNISKRIKT